MVQMKNDSETSDIAKPLTVYSKPPLELKAASVTDATLM